MKKFAFTIVCLLIAGTLAFADGAPKEKDKNASTDKNITGCLSGPNAEGAYVLKTDKGDVEVGSDSQLKEHVGHEVKLTGEYAKPGAAMGENEAAEKKQSGAKSGMGDKDKNERHFKVSKIEHISDSCTSK